MAESAMISENIEAMNRLEGFDVVIVCTGTALQANFWQTRLDGCKGSVVSKSATIVAVDEDWEGGAGNGKSSCVWGKAECATFLGGLFRKKPGAKVQLSTVLFFLQHLHSVAPGLLFSSPAHHIALLFYVIPV